MIDSPPRAVYSTITRGRGAQTAGHAAPAPATDIKVRFADPHSPRRRPTNENTGGPVREYFPKGTDFNNIRPPPGPGRPGRLNRRPREVLNGQTPPSSTVQPPPDTAPYTRVPTWSGFCCTAFVTGPVLPPGRRLGHQQPHGAPTSCSAPWSRRSSPRALNC